MHNDLNLRTTKICMWLVQVRIYVITFYCSCDLMPTFYVNTSFTYMHAASRVVCESVLNSVLEMWKNPEKCFE